ncbi:MAG: biotin--[acetyl-CoA-carboxylase] ligase [Clostridiales bacterium]|jgi:BirA family biotin operon repressor/biotin-[acetyl-CoA-carboxylase] ligase|nr:biotin--[acetyl-CoA-carboxylase] ligase [Clostridiales bacterium]
MNTKIKLLTLLEGACGKSISGESIAAELGVSRAAVWKAVNALKRDGCIIEGVQNRGYRLTGGVLNADAILPYLKFPARINRVRVFPVLESTNKTAKETAVSGAYAVGENDDGNRFFPVVIIADTQTAGRGRLGRSFYSPAGTGLYMSFILRPEYIALPQINSVTVYAAAAVCKAIKTVCGAECGIKWVNDIFLNGKKICGILTEAVSDLESASVEHIILGIGINVATTNFPEDLASVAGAIFPQSDVKQSYNAELTSNTAASDIFIGNMRKRLAAELINIFDGAYPEFTFESALAEYCGRMLFRGKTVTVSKADAKFDAEVVGIDAVGRLTVKKSDGAIENLLSGEIILR